LNLRKVLGSLAGFVILAGVSYHQVRHDGIDPRDQSVMTGTAVTRSAERADSCAQQGKGRGDDSTGAATDCADPPRR